MKINLLATIALVVQVLLGNFCFVDIVIAASLPMPAEEEIQMVQEMVMTPKAAMSPLHCDSCITVMRPRHHSDLDGMRVPCGYGHCLMEHTPSTAIITQSPQKDSIKNAALPVFASYVEPVSDMFRSRWSERSPIQVSLIQTVVLRE